MKITIQGSDYTLALDSTRPLTIERKLNEPSTCSLTISLPANGALQPPTRNHAVCVSGDDGTSYFTGYLAVSPMPEYAGMAMEGPRYRFVLQAVSDEILLDQALMAPSKAMGAGTAGALVAALASHTGCSALSTKALALSSEVASFAPEAGAVFSKSAGRVANQVRGAYRAAGGALTVTVIPGAVHTLNESDGSLTLGNLSLTANASRSLANDITVCGEHEPAAYVTEYFQGDGTSTQFFLSADPFFPASDKCALVTELFNEISINSAVWGNPGGSNYFSIGPAGLTMTGGNGVDGQTQLTWIDPIEMGGTLLLEADGVSLSNASTGVVAGFYAGVQSIAGCICGFQAIAQQGTGAVSIQPIVFGCTSGISYPLSAADQYTLRLRVHCQENERALATYIACSDKGLVSTGGTNSSTQAKLLFEIQPFIDGVAGMPVILYDGVIAALPASCSLVAASSMNLIGSLRALRLTNLGSGWVVSTPPGGAAYTRRVGSVAQNAECHLERTGKLAFYTGFTPALGEQIAVTYRTVGRAVGRAVDAQSQSTLSQAGLPSCIAWTGSVTSPAARSSADCRNAAAAMVQAASSVSALWSGTYRASGLSFSSDVWPGDALLINASSCNLNAQLVIRSVKLTYTASVPDLVNYSVAFANDWANDLAIKTSATVPADAWLPAPVAPTVLANLTALTVTSLTGSTVTINTGTTAPAGGGFEIRRRDFAFGPGEDPDLVMRGSQPTLTFSRVSANDQFFVRMYDGNTPPNYSEFSAALFINLPLSS